MTDQPPPGAYPPPGYEPLGGPPSPPGEPPAALHGYADANSPEQSKGGRVIVAAVGGVLALALGMVGVTALFGSGGSATPEEAVERLFESIERQDAIGVMESLTPGEREVLLDPMVEMTGHLQRLGVLSEFGLDDVPGAEIEFEGLELRSAQVTDDIVWVEVVSGTVTATVQADAVPLGPVWDRFDPEVESSTDPTDLADDDLALAAIRRDGGWHVSIGYSVAESARREAGEGFPSGDRLTPAGADSPDAVITELVRAANELDGELALGMLDPVEFEAMYDYSPMFLPFTEEDSSSEMTMELTDLVTREEGNGNRRRVYVEAFSFEVETYYPRWGEREYTSITFADGCMAIEEVREYEVGPTRVGTWEDDDGHHHEGGWSDSYDSCDADGTDDYFGAGFGWWMGDDAGLADMLGLSVVERDGRWYLSPTRTVLDTMNEAMAQFDREDIEGWLDWFEDWEDNFYGTSEMFTEVGPVTDDDWGTPLPGDPAWELWWDGMEAACGALRERAWETEDSGITRVDPEQAVDPWQELMACEEAYERANPMPGPNDTSAIGGREPHRQTEPGSGGGVADCVGLLDDVDWILEYDPYDIVSAEEWKRFVSALEAYVACGFEEVGVQPEPACTEMFAWMREQGPEVMDTNDPPPEVAPAVDACEAAMVSAGL
ncbi:MAG: hypothetical protein JJU45_03070 [Acidimicrobiia bacterium]|nr:hypothetical protein [Acidimicrobiia bacterium]